MLSNHSHFHDDGYAIVLHQIFLRCEVICIKRTLKLTLDKLTLDSYCIAISYNDEQDTLAFIIAKKRSRFATICYGACSLVVCHRKMHSCSLVGLC